MNDKVIELSNIEIHEPHSGSGQKAKAFVPDARHFAEGAGESKYLIRFGAGGFQ